jgi:hypothetical protein
MIVQVQNRSCYKDAEVQRFSRGAEKGAKVQQVQSRC